MSFSTRFENAVNARYRHHNINLYDKPSFSAELPFSPHVFLAIMNSSVIFLLQNLVNKKTRKIQKFCSYFLVFFFPLSFYHFLLSFKNLDSFTFSSRSFLISFDRKNLWNTKQILRFSHFWEKSKDSWSRTKQCKYKLP